MVRAIRVGLVFAIMLALLGGAGCGPAGLTTVNGSILTSIEVTPADPSLPAGTIRQFTAKGTYSDNTTADITDKVTWTSSDTDKATITNTGLATGIAKGTTTIKASLAFVTGAVALTITVLPAKAQWARVDATADYTYSDFYSVATGTDGSVYAAGSLWLDNATTHDFGNGVTITGTTTGNTSVLTKYDSSGNAQWAKTPVAGTVGFSGVTVAPDGSVFAVGSAYGTIDFGDGVVTTGSSSYGSDILLVKYDSAGIPQWAKTIAARPSGSGDSTAFMSVAVSADGSIYAAGTIGYYYSAATITVTGTYDFGNGVMVTGPFAGRDNSLLVKYDSSGTPLWVRAVAKGSGGSAFNGVTVASDGSVYAAGYMVGSGTYDLGNSVTVAGSLDGRNSLLVKYNSSGAAQWARTVNSTPGTTDMVSAVVFNGVSAASDGSIYAAGSIKSIGIFDFGNTVTVTGTSTRGNDAVVLVKYDPFGAAQWARTVSSGDEFDSSMFSSVSAAPDGFVYAAGSMYGIGTFDFGDTATTIGTYYGRIILVKYSGTGTAQWVVTLVPGVNQSWCYGVSAASDGSVYATGWIYDADPYDGDNTLDFGNSVTATGNYVENFFLVKYQ